MTQENLSVSEYPYAGVFQSFGHFMVAWSVLENALQAAVMKELGIEGQKAAVVLGKLQFYPLMKLLEDLLKLAPGKHARVKKLLANISAFADRNILVHGRIVVGPPGVLTFVKCEGATTVERTFNSISLTARTLELNALTQRLQLDLEVSDDDLRAIVDGALTLREGKK